jgi:hypothetical protein
MQRRRIVVAGGGAAGFFGAITCAEDTPDAEVLLLEKSPALLAKVTISGGGRCNVTHACFDPRRLAEYYPRGGRELLGPFHRWQAQDTVDWFTARGVPLKTEADGRMFPVANKSSAVVACLERCARAAGVKVFARRGVRAARRAGAAGGFTLDLTTGETMACDALLLATGGNRNSAGYALASGLGHTIVDPVPSLFTLHVRDARVEGLAGISVPEAELSVPGSGLRQRGPLLVTHEGLSGPAVLKLSAWGARALHDAGYAFDLQVNWAPDGSRAELTQRLQSLKHEYARKHVDTFSPMGLPARLWKSLVRAAGIGEGVPWANVSQSRIEGLSRELGAGVWHVSGKSLFKEEFVTCGGVSLREVDFRTMQSRVCPGLFLAGELLDIDGVTGGFNFQAAWTTGWIAGKSMGQVAQQGAGS